MSINSKKLIEVNSDICKIDDRDYPSVALGTYPLKKDICFNAVSIAAEIGYRIIDTATFYDNFDPIGKALKKHGRDNFYVISKVWHDSQTNDLLINDAKKTLQELQTDYLDAYLLHWPNHQVPIEESLNAMKQLQNDGIIKHIGVSNFTINHLKHALKCGVAIQWLQVEMNPFFYDADLLAFCNENNITVQAWSPLADGKVMQDHFLKELAEKYGKSSAQIAIKWVIQNKCLPLAQSSSSDHILKNFEVMDFSLSQEEVNKINEKARNGNRIRLTKDFGLGFTDEFDFSYEECWPKA